MNRMKMLNRWLGMLLVAAMLVSLLPSLVVPGTANAATTGVTIIKYASDGTTVLAQTTVTYQRMRDNMPVLGDGTTHYYLQGPVFIDDADEANEEALRWNPAEDTNVQEKDMGALRGTNIKDLCNLVGGMSAGEELKVKASDGWSKMYAYKNVYQYSIREGPMVLTWEKDGLYPDTGYTDGMRLIWFADTSTNPWGIHAFGNYDWHEAADPEYWYYYIGSGGERYPTTTGLSGFYVSQLLIYSNLPATHSISASAGANGSISPSGGVSVAHGASQTFSITPNTGYHVSGVLVDGSSVGAVTSYTFTNVTANHTISASFAGSVIPPPVAAFSADVVSGAAPLTVHFTDQSTGSPTSWAWDFGDGATSTTQSPTHTYDAAGMYSVKLTVASAAGSDAEEKTDYITVTVPVLPIAAFAADVVSGASPLTVHFTDQSTGSPASWAWDFDNDGDVDSTVQNPTYTYTVAGTYSVKLTVTNATGSDPEVKTDLITVTAPVPVLPVAAFAADVVSGAAPLTLHFTDQSTGSPASWVWDLDNDGDVDSTVQNPTYTYMAAGTYGVKLTVTNVTGSDSEVKTSFVTVTVPPTGLLWGPYLTGTTTTGTVVNVKANLPAGVTVHYATETQYTASGTYNQTATDGTNTQLHHIALSGLEANTVYHYRVLYGTEATADCHFRTFPTSGPFSFVVLSDTQDQLPTFSQSERFKLVADSIAAQPDVAFVLITGDLVNDGSDAADWDRFFDAGRQMLANTTIYTALGNHEDDDALYYDAFGLSAYYSFDCGDAHFAVLDSTKSVSAQTAWLDGDLDSGKPWKFVAFHHPLYTSDANHFGGWANLRAEWEGLFQTHGVDAVWSGNVHAYERYLENGITYMVMGTGGAPLYQLSEEKYDGYQNSLENSLAYAKVTVDASGGTSTVQVVRVADVSVDNSKLTTVYPQDTVFETVVLAQSGNQPDWDLNGDHVSNICDVVLMGLRWGETGSPGWITEDVNNDGVVDHLDVAVIDLNWEDIW